MTRYHMVKEDVAGFSEDRPEEYDLMEVIMIRRGGDGSDEAIFDFLNGIFHSNEERVSRYIGEDAEIRDEVKKMGGFGQALVDRTERIAIEKGIGIGREEGIGIGRTNEQRERIADMLRRGKSPQEIADFCNYPIALVKEVEQGMLVM